MWLTVRFIHIRFIECASDCHMVIFYKAAKRLPLSSMSDLFPSLMFLQTDTLLATLQSKHIFISKHNPSLRHVEAYWDTQGNCEGRLWMRDAKLMRWGGSVWEIQRERERGNGMYKRKWLHMTQSLFVLSSSFFLKALHLINAESVPDSHIPASAHWRWSYLFRIF